MKLLLLIAFCFTMANVAYSQSSVRILTDTVIGKKEGIVLSNDTIILEGGTLRCGRGTLPNGDFKYIHTSPSSWVAITAQRSDGSNPGIISLGRSFSGLNVSVKAVKKVGNKKRGYKYLLKVGGGNIVNYEVEIADAIATGEIIVE